MKNRQIAVLGAGLMGHGIALALARAGQYVAIADPVPAARAAVAGRIADSLRLLGAAEAEVARVLKRIEIVETVAGAVHDADFVIEAAPEKLDLKRALFAEVFRLTAAQLAPLGGGSGTSLPPAVVKGLAGGRDAREAVAYWLALGAAVGVIGAAYGILRSRRGLALTAIRDNELAARSLGIDIWRTKFFVYVVTAGLTGMLGALIFVQKLRISPDAAFSVNDWTAFVIFIVVIGGIGTLEGPIIGTLIFFALRETLADLGSVYLIALGGVAIVVMLRAPHGVWGLIRARTGAELFPLSRRVTGLPGKQG